MIYIAFSVLCSVTVAILLKLARRYKISIVQAVTFNYLFAMILGVLFFKPDLNLFPTISSPIYIGLGILLPAVFWLLAGSIRKIGIAKTDIAQRLSLVIPIAAAYFLFNEHFSVLKIAGLLVGFSAIVLILYKTGNGKGTSKDLIFPLSVFIGYGIIDVLFKKTAQIQSIPYTTSLTFIFFISFVVSLLGIAYLLISKKEKFQLINVLCGCILGLFNFGNILFYLKAHQSLSNHPSTVFATMNMGVILMGCLIGVFVFKEKLSTLNYLGFLMALTAVILISIS
jgi:drug/metabolite transporter (DMT)-like permease